MYTESIKDFVQQRYSNFLIMSKGRSRKFLTGAQFMGQQPTNFPCPFFVVDVNKGTYFHENLKKISKLGFCFSRKEKQNYITNSITLQLTLCHPLLKQQ